MSHIPRIAITVGEPAGIGPDLIAHIAQRKFAAEIVVIGAKKVLLERAQQLNLPLILHDYNENSPQKTNSAGTLSIIDISCAATVIPGKLNPSNVPQVLATLELAAKKSLSGEFAAIVTAPVHKGIINDAGVAFSGHTEFFAASANVADVVMLLTSSALRVALVTTHLPLSKVPAAITKEKLTKTLEILLANSALYFGTAEPTILVCGLNPHAGENGHLGLEEIEIIMPVIQDFQKAKHRIIGPLPADTIFTQKYLNEADVILAMYHDQGLPIIKHVSFGHAVNVTLGLPFIRTSVDHGTALEIAGTGTADPGSLIAAINTAIEITKRK